MKSHKIIELESQESNDLQLSNIESQLSTANCIKDSKNCYASKESLTYDNGNNLKESDFESLPEKNNILASFLKTIKQTIGNYNIKYPATVKWTTCLIILFLYSIFFSWCVICKTREGVLWRDENNFRLLWITAILYLVIIYKLIMAIFKWQNINISCEGKFLLFWKKVIRLGFYVFCGLSSLLIIIYVVYTAIRNEPYNLVSFFGIIVLILFSYIFSTAPNMVNWKPVLLGLLLQFFFGLIILTTNIGYNIFKFIGDRVTDFLNFTEEGSKMVFGLNFTDHYFAFRVLPIVVFLSSVMAVLYHLGVIQMLVITLGTSMQWFMGTTCGESLNAAANIFLGMTESPLLIKPLLGRMTNSELHAIMTGGFATIAGSVLGAYIGFGAPANHLISASVMSAPAALAISKLMYPETKKSKNTKDDVKHLPKSPYKNIVEATTAGASDSIPLVANIAVNLIAFVAILAFFNAILAWLGEQACMEQKLSFELICSYVFWPLALCMGVYIQDCRKVAELMGIKTFLNEFVAFKSLGVLISNEKIYRTVNTTMDIVNFNYDNIIINFHNGTNATLTGGILYKDRSVVIATYALCGFANFGSMGILLSSLITMIPHRRSDLSKLVVRAMIAGNVACFLTACIAGLFYKEK